MARLIANTYGKGGVRVTKVVREGAVHSVFEMEVQVLLEGAFEETYTAGDNARCVPTDTMKNTVYVLAKRHDFDSPEGFAKIVAGHFVESFGHVTAAAVEIEMVLWERIEVGDTGHEHAFKKASNAVRLAKVRAERGKEGKVWGGIRDLEVIKTTKSAFTGYVVDKYTTLKPAKERIFGTSVEAVWTYVGEGRDYNRAFEGACRAMLETFAGHDSLGVQHTIFAMGEAVLGAVPLIAEVSFTMPNQHRILANLEPFGLSNGNEVFVNTSEPFGLIKGTVGR